MSILITGAAGYIGQCLEKIFKNKRVILLDKKNLNYKSSKKFYKINLLNKKKLSSLFGKEKINTIIHLAGESLVNEKKSFNIYYKNNIQVIKNILFLMEKNKVKNIIFSSTASVYKSSNKTINEKSDLAPKSKYAKTKLKCERLIQKSKLNYIILRFFNVASSLPNYLRGENHIPETHLIPLFVQNAMKGKNLKIFGTNYSTFDGTCVRDFVHIRDICDAIIKSSKKINQEKINEILNIGTNRGYSVKEILFILKKILKKDIKYKIYKKRKGDSPKLVSDFKKANKILSWYPKNSQLKKIISDEIKWKKLV